MSFGGVTGQRDVPTPEPTPKPMSATLLAPAPAAALSPASPTRRALWASRVLSGIAVLFLAVDAAVKLLVAPEAVSATTTLGWSADQFPTLGLIQLACLVLYLVPRTALFGAVLWTGYLGGAIATHLRVENPLFSHTLFPVYVAVLVWGGLYLRDGRLRALLHSTR